jgi:hypothetical protein
MAGLATGSHGLVTHGELLGARVTRKEIRQRLQTGALIVEYPGVYRVGHRAPSVEARYLAAVKACGKGAVLSGRAAGHLWGVAERGRARAGGNRTDRAPCGGGDDEASTQNQDRGDDLARRTHHHPPAPLSTWPLS